MLVVSQRRLNEPVTAGISARPKSGLSPGFSLGRGHAWRFNRSTSCGTALVSSSVAHGSCRDRCLIQPTTVDPPAILTNTRPCAVLARARFRCHPAQCRVRAMTVKIALEIKELQPRSAAVQNSVRSRHSRRIVPIRRSTNGCDSGAYGTVLMGFTSRIRRFACHWWNRYSGS